jgi:tol-pal system protein YbgF
MLRKLIVGIVVVAGLVLCAPGVSRAASKEHQQMLADIRMLQEQNALLQAHLLAVTDALRQLATKIDEQSGVNRKAFADQKLLVDTVANDLRVVREKVDDNNVRISSLSQELEAVRLAIPQAAPQAAAPPADAAGAAPATPTGAPVQPPAPASPAVSPQRIYDMALADYMGAQYNLAIAGFENYIRTFAKSEQAGGAQYYIGECYYQQGMFREAVAAYDRGISDYPSSKQLPDMYYKRGLALNALGQTDRARESWEFVIKNYPNSDAGRLAKQSLDRLVKRDGEGDDDPPTE